MKKQIIAFFLVFSSICFSQTGPGGVGNIEGTSSLKLWLLAKDLNADGIITNNPTAGDRINSWNDYSGNSNNYTNTGNSRPTYNSTTFNAINFDASLGTAQFLNASTSGMYSEASTFFALNPTNSGNSNSLFDGNSLSLRVEQWRNTNKLGYTRYGVKDYSTSINSPFNIDVIISLHKENNSSNITFYSNNNTNTINVDDVTVGIPYNRIGRNSNGSDEASGNFYEVILYNNKLSTAKRIIVENYLSAKYGSIAITDNIYNEDESGNFDYKVAGIGQAIDGSNHTDSQGLGIVKINTPDDLQNNEYLFWGENEENSNYEFSIVGPSNKRHRINTTWRVSERGSVGKVTFSIKASDINLTGIPDGVLKLVRSTVSDFSSIIQEHPLTLSNNIYSTTLTFNDNEYFTLETVPTADLKLIKKVNKAVPKLNETIVFTISVTNNGPQNATGVKIKDKLPPELQYNLASSTIPSGTTYNETTGIWDFGNVSIAKGQTIDLKIAAVVLTQGVLITNSAEIFP